MKPSSVASKETVALSVSTSARLSPGATASPTFLCHFTTAAWGRRGGRRVARTTHTQHHTRYNSLEPWVIVGDSAGNTSVVDAGSAAR